MSNRKKAERNFMECIIREWRIEDADGKVLDMHMYSLIRQPE